MINLRNLDDHRTRHGWEATDLSTNGAFVFSSSFDGGQLRVIASSGMGWDHVSVSRERRIPEWLDMEKIRRIFFKPEEFAFQYHAPIADYVDGTTHGGCVNCLHLWRPHDVSGFPIPPRWMVGGMSPKEAHAAYLAAGGDPDVDVMVTPAFDRKK